MTGTTVTTRYEKELANLNAVYEEALKLDVAPFREALQTASSRPAVMIGSGGSYSVASFAAFLHQLNTGRLASALTPLDYMTLPLRDVAVACFSAAGKNKDICAAFDEAAQREAKPLLGLVMRATSPLHRLSAHYRYSRVISAPATPFTDGFLAVGTLLGSCVFLLRTYRALVGDRAALPHCLPELVARTANVSLDELPPLLERALAPGTTSILHSSSLKPAAVDIESRFVEAALGGVHGTDLRNFGHGRHHWFAKRKHETGLIALVGDDQESLATRTLSLLPKAVRSLRIDFRGRKDEQALVGLLVSLHLAGVAGRLRGIDPGKPGVPEFGRKLYHLAPAKRRKARKDELTETAAWRKEMAAGLRTSDQLTELHTLCAHAITRLNHARLAAFVFDYDGTLCEPDGRFDPLSGPIADGLNKLLHEGAIVGIATGRGGSAADSLRAAVKEDYWDNIVMGLYNGAVICSLKDGPPPSPNPDPQIARLEAVLRSSRHFSNCRFRSNRNQIAISLPPLEEPVVSVRTAAALVEHAGFTATVRCSSHSIDVTFGDTRKTAVVEAVRRRVGAAADAPVLRIGDKGHWPGNDAELLDDAYGISVDEVSPSAETCWGLSPRGILGVQATLYYLSRIHWKHGAGSINFD
jgi:hydroxymethylpyrimidine pyrophosphatase-like HAD family hydrolase